MYGSVWQVIQGFVVLKQNGKNDGFTKTSVEL